MGLATKGLTCPGDGGRGGRAFSAGGRPPLRGSNQLMPFKHASCPLQAGFKRSRDYFWPRTEAILVRLL